jgi:septal ring factor EnvC (AmiA/AmiB activator)
MIRTRKILSSLFFSLFICTGTAFAGDDIAVNGVHVETQKKRLQETQEELKHKKAGEKAALEREISILGTLSRMERNLLQREKELGRLDSQYDRIRRNTVSVREKLNQIQRKIDQNQTRLHSRIVAMYKAGRIGYLPYVLSSDSYNDFMRMMKFLKIVIDYDANLLRNYQAQRLEKTQYQEKLENDIKKLKQVRAEQEGKKIEILHAKREKRAFLKQVRRQKAEYRKWIRELEDRARELQLLIKKLEREMRDKAVYGLNFKGHKGRLLLPVRGTVIAEKRGRGIIIEAPKNSPVRAVFPGRVIYSGWFEGYGNIIILDHGDKYYTVSGHASKVLKRVNEPVAEGEVIALVGDTGSIRGPCLYFEIRYKGKPEDPLKWLSISKDSSGPSKAKKGSGAAGGRGKT